MVLDVSGSETVYVDPQNRDAVIRRRGDELGSQMMKTCTAYIVDVARGDGLRYSIPVRYSRFERLHAELLAELPAALHARLPRLPAKRGPLDPAKLSKLLASIGTRLAGDPDAHGGPGATTLAQGADDPQLIEERTRGLDRYLRALLALPGVATSAALLDLVALSGSAEAAVRQALEAAASHDEARASALTELSKELATSSAYVRTARAARERSEARAAALGGSLDAALLASADLLARHTDSVRVARAWRLWLGCCRQREAHAHAKQLRQAARTEDSQRERSRLLEAEVELLRTQLAASQAALADEQRSAARHLDEVVALRAANIQADARLREAARTAAEQIGAAEAKADAATEAAGSAEAHARRATADAEDARAALAALRAALAAADEELALAHRCVASREAGTAALHAERDLQRRRRVALALRCALEQRANEARLLFLLQSQREALDRSALELAAVRRAAAVDTNRPEHEAPWLAEPATGGDAGQAAAAEAHAAAEAEAAAAAAQQQQRETEAQRNAVEEKWRKEWLAAMAHTL